MAAILKGSLACSKSFACETPVTLRFELTNRGKHDLYVLKWFTPLEGLVSDCLSIKRNGKTRVPYDGPLVKRGNPGPDDYILVPAGKTVSTDVNVSESYAVSRPADYQVELNVADVEHLPVATPGRKVSAATLAKRTPLKQSLVGGKTKFKVKKGMGRILTRGQSARQTKKSVAKANLKKSSPGGAKSSASPLPPKIIGGSTSQKKQAIAAHEAGHQLCESALQRLTDDAEFVEWFGTHTKNRFAKVQSAFSRVQSRMAGTTFFYNLSGQGCPTSALAYTFKNTSTIWCCPPFWKVPATGTDSQAGTVVHEHSHCDAGTADLAYGQTSARSLAKKSPDRAVRNADNFEYYAGG